MGAQQRVYRQRIRSTQGLKKIFSAMELIATSRIARARQAVTASTPYARAITRAVSAVATFSDIDHPLTTEKTEVRRAAVLLITSDRGMAGSYSANVLKEGERLTQLLREEGKEVVPYLLGRKAVGFYKFRRRHVEQEWTGSSEAPTYELAREVGQTLVDAFVRGSDGPDSGGVDEIHIVYTRFVSMVTQTPEVVRMLPLEVVEGVADPDDTNREVLALYDFEPSAEAVLDALLPRYVSSRIYNCMLQAAASEHAARQRAMKAASDNASDLILTYTRLANAARQDQITQEISEIVGGAAALADAGADR